MKSNLLSIIALAVSFCSAMIIGVVGDKDSGVYYSRELLYVAIGLGLVSVIVAMIAKVIRIKKMIKGRTSEILAIIISAVMIGAALAELLALSEGPSGGLSLLLIAGTLVIYKFIKKETEEYKRSLKEYAKETKLINEEKSKQKKETRILKRRNYRAFDSEKKAKEEREKIELEQWKLRRIQSHTYYKQPEAYKEIFKKLKHIVALSFDTMDKADTLKDIMDYISSERLKIALITVKNDLFDRVIESEYMLLPSAQEIDEVEPTLEAIINEIHFRGKRFLSFGAKNINQYNDKVEGIDYMPRIILCITDMHYYNRRPKILGLIEQIILDGDRFGINVLAFATRADFVTEYMLKSADTVYTKGELYYKIGLTKKLDLDI